MMKKQILIVEDEIIVAKNLQDRLENMGYVVTAIASSGEEAIEKATQTQPDLILMDIKLEGDVDGIEVAQYIRDRFGIPVVYLTAYATEDILQRAKITEPFGYILKPFEIKELHATIEMALYKYEMERKLKESKQWFATTLRCIGDAVIATNTRGWVIFMNPVAEALTGWTQEEAYGRELTEIFPVLDKEAGLVRENLARRVLQEGVIVNLSNSTVLISRDGTEIFIDDTVAPIRDEQGKIIGVVLVFQDARMRRRAEEEQEQLIAELQSALAKVKLLSGFLPICASCKKIRDDQGYWNQIKIYIRDHSEAEFTHSLCPECLKKLYPDFYKDS